MNDHIKCVNNGIEKYFSDEVVLKKLLDYEES